MDVREKNCRNFYLDIFRIFLVCLVILIHYGPAETIHLCRLAVPMFFIISGYFLYHDDDSLKEKNARRFLINSFKYLIIGLSIYFIYDFIVVLKNNESISQFFRNLFVSDFVKNIIFLNSPVTSGYHLWFLIALAVVACIHYILCYFNKTKYYYIIIPVCLAIGLFFGGYVNLIQPNSVSIMFAPRNALFEGLPLVGLGYLLNKWTFLHKKHFYKWIYLVLGIVMFILQGIVGKVFSMEIYTSSILSAVFLLLFLVQLKKFPFPKLSNFYYKYIGKQMVFYVYILHIAVGQIVIQIISNIYLRLILIFIISFIIYEIFHLLRLLINKFFIKHRTIRHDGFNH